MPTLLLLTAFLTLACWHDLQSRRIPNALVAVGLAVGLLIQAMAHAGGGLFHFANPGALGLPGALLGALTGLLLFLPFYAFKAMGAGDAKLMSMVGAWLGASSVAWAALFTLAAGGVLSIVVMLAGGHSGAVARNLKAMFERNATLQATTQTVTTREPHRVTGRVPYALAITAGTAIEIGRHLI